MLNEIAEYKQYTNPKYCNRLNSLKKGKDLNGLNRAMTIVARYWLFKDPTHIDIDKARTALEIWCGLSDNDNNEFCCIKDCLKTIMGKDKWEDEFNNKRRTSIRGKLFSEELNDSAYNDFRKITYDRIIADANAQGPLKKYYLVCKKSFYEGNLKYSTDKEDNILRNKQNSNISSKLKITAYYLLNKDIFTQTDLENWGVSDRKTLITYSYNKEKLYKKEEVTKNVSRLLVPECWLENFKIIEENEFEDWYKINKNDWVFWSDNGNGFTNINNRNVPVYLDFNKKYPKIREKRNITSSQIAK